MSIRAKLGPVLLATAFSCVSARRRTVDGKTGYVVKGQRGYSGAAPHFDAEEVSVLDAVQYEGRPQVVFFGADLDVVELNSLDVAHLQGV